MTAIRGRATVRRAALLKHVAYLRNLFRTLDLDVAAYSDDTLVDAVLSISSGIDDEWPSDAHLQEAFTRLSTRH